MADEAGLTSTVCSTLANTTDSSERKKEVKIRDEASQDAEDDSLIGSKRLRGGHKRKRKTEKQLACL